VCTDVLEHVEPDRLLFVLEDLARLTKKVGYFVIHLGRARRVCGREKCPPDPEGQQWWKNRLKAFFVVGKMCRRGNSFM